MKNKIIFSLSSRWFEVFRNSYIRNFHSMDQNSGDVEPNNPEGSIREQFKKKYHKDEKAENVMSSDLICVLSSPDPPTVDSKVSILKVLNCIYEWYNL